MQVFKKTNMAAEGGGMEMTRRAFLTYPACIAGDDPGNAREWFKGNSIRKEIVLRNGGCNETTNREDLTSRSVGLRNARVNIRRDNI
jgi:hypothetical protein